MTTLPDAAAPESAMPQERTRSWGEIAVALARQLARGDFRRGDLADLRRMDLDGPEPAVFWRLMAQYDLLDRGPMLENKWKLILHGIALMTPTAGDNSGSGSGDANARSAHEGRMPVGRALFLGKEANRANAFYSELRLNRLLTSREGMTQTLLARTFRMLAAADVSFNWQEMAWFILNDGYDAAAAENSRRRIARDYYQAERRSVQSSAESD